MESTCTDEEHIALIQSKITFLQNQLNQIKSELDNNEKILFEILKKQNNLKI